MGLLEQLKSFYKPPMAKATLIDAKGNFTEHWINQEETLKLMQTAEYYRELKRKAIKEFIAETTEYRFRKLKKGRVD